MRTNDSILCKNLQKYCIKIICDVQYYRVINHKNQKDDYDYPAVIVGCKYKSFRKFGRSASSHLPQYNRIKNVFLHSAVDVAVSNTYAHADKSKGNRGWYDRTCAEDHAASECLFSCEKNNKKLPNSLSDLEFTIALRPRTGGKVEYCNTCKAVFGL